MMRLFPAVFLLFLFTGNAAAASRAADVKEGNALYLDGDYAASIGKYEQALEKDRESDIINFDIGTAYYKNKDYQKALSHLQKSLLSEDTVLLGKTHYNIGNTYYQSGIVQEENNIDTAIASLEQSLAHFEGALTIDDKDEDAGYNYEFVKKELDRLKEKKESRESREQSTKDKGHQPEASAKGRSASGGDPPPAEAQGNEDEQEAQSTQQTREGEEHQPKADPHAEEEGENQERGQEQGMSEKEARMLLDNYQQNEEPQGLLNFMKRKGKESPVLKDW